MAVKWILTQGIGFNPGSTRYMPPLGFLAEVAVAPTPTPSNAISWAVPWYPIRRREPLVGTVRFLLTMKMVAQGQADIIGVTAATLSLRFAASGYKEAIASAAFTSAIGMKGWGRVIRTRQQREEEEFELLGI